MLSPLRRLQNDAAADLEIPQSDQAILVACRHKATIRKEGHATDFTVVRSFEHVGYLHFLGVPESNGVVQRASDYFRFVFDLLVGLLLKSLGVKTDNFEDCIRVAFDVGCLLAHFYSKCLHASLEEAE